MTAQTEPRLADILDAIELCGGKCSPERLSIIFERPSHNSMRDAIDQCIDLGVIEWQAKELAITKLYSQGELEPVPCKLPEWLDIEKGIYPFEGAPVEICINGKPSDEIATVEVHRGKPYWYKMERQYSEKRFCGHKWVAGEQIIANITHWRGLKAPSCFPYLVKP